MAGDRVAGSSFTLSLLGEPVLAGPQGAVRLRGLKGRALLWYLAAQPDRAFPRAHLAALLWEDGGAEEARHNLASTLNRLRAELPVWPLRAHRDAVTWDPSAGVAVDVDRFLRLAGPAAAPEALAAAAALWRGPFLDGFFLPGGEAYEEWLRQQRERWTRRVLDALDRLTRHDEAGGRWDALAAHARQALAIDPLQERFHRALMLAAYQAGDRAAALAQYDACRHVLREQVGVEPDAATTALRDAIAGGRLPRRDAGPDAPPDLPRAEPPPALPPQPPLVGRDADVAGVEAALAAATAGRGRAVLLHGEAGIGKTRLVEEVLRRAAQPGSGSPARPHVLLGRCYESGRDLPYAPFTEALTGLLRHVDVGHLDVPPAWLAEVGRLLPDLAVLRPDLPPPATLDPGQQRLRLFEGVARLLGALPGPALLVLEDLHWADDATLRLLAHLVRHPMTGSLAVLVTARSGDLPQDVENLLRQLQREGVLNWRDVAPLSVEAVESLAASFTGRRDPPLAQRLHARTQGNPLFAVELLRSLGEAGLLAALSPGDVDRLPIPPTVQAVIAARMERHPAPARDLVAAAAIFPGAAPFPLVRRVARLREAAALPALESLLRAGILREVRDGRSPATAPAAQAERLPAVAFSHDLVGRVIREGLSEARRQALHRRAYRLLAAVAGRDGAAARASAAWCEALAFHATAGGLWQQGVSWSLRAAEAAERVYAYAGATRFLEQALANLERLPATPESRQQAIDVRLRAAEMGFRHHPARSEDLLEAATTEAAAVGDNRRQHRAWLGRALTYLIQGRLPLAASLLERLLPVARAAGSESLLAHSLTYSGQLLATRGDLHRAVPLLEEARGLHERLGHQLQEAETGGALASVYAGLGEFDRAAALAGRYAERGRRLGDRAMTALLLAHLASVAHFAGRWPEAVAAAREALRAARAGEHRLHEYVAGVFLGLPLARTGDLEGGIRAQEDSIALAAEVGMRVLVDRAHAWLAEMLLEAGDVAAAREAARKGLEIAESDGYQYGFALNTRMLAQIAAAAGRPAEARRELSAALERFAAQGARPEVARCHALIADLAETDAGRAEHRRQAAGMFRAMGMAWDLERLLAGPAGG